MDNAIRPSDVALAPPPAIIGHNNPPAFDPEPLALLDTRINDFAAAGGEWLDLETITTEQQAAHLTDFIAGARKLKSEVEAWHKVAKAPHLEGGRAVDAAAKSPVAVAERVISRALALISPWQSQKKREAEERERLVRQAAAEKLAEAQRLAQQAAQRNDIAGEVAAEALAKEAVQETRAAERLTAGAGQVQSASGGGRTIALVTTRSAQINNIRLAFMAVQDHPYVVEAIQRALNERIRAKDFNGAAIPGVTIIKTESAR